MSTVRDIATDALREIGVLAAGEVATADEANTALEKLNQLIDQWAAERLQIFQTTRTVWTIISGTQSYTLGTGGLADVARPVYIDHINYQNTASVPSIEFQMSALTDDAWSKVPIKDLTSPMPTCWYYNPTYPFGTIQLWPVPTLSTLEGVIYAPQAVAEFASLNDVVALPPGYRRMLVKNLAVTLASSYERDPRQTLVEEAKESKGVVKRANKRLLDMSIENAALVQGAGRQFWYNIFVGP